MALRWVGNVMCDGVEVDGFVNCGLCTGSARRSVQARAQGRECAGGVLIDGYARSAQAPYGAYSRRFFRRSVATDRWRQWLPNLR